MGEQRKDCVTVWLPDGIKSSISLDLLKISGFCKVLMCIKVWFVKILNPVVPSPYRFLPGCAKTSYSRLMKLPEF